MRVQASLCFVSYPFSLCWWIVYNEDAGPASLSIQREQTSRWSCSSKTWLLKQKNSKYLKNAVSCIPAYCRAAEVHRNLFRINQLCVLVMHIHRVKLRKPDVVFCWHTARIYLWINMRENQINKRTAGKKIILLKIKQQAPFPLLLPFSLALIFLQFIPIFLGSSMLPPCPLTLLTFLTRLLSNYTLTRYINFRFPSSSFSSSFLHLPHPPSPFHGRSYL